MAGSQPEMATSSLYKTAHACAHTLIHTCPERSCDRPCHGHFDTSMAGAPLQDLDTWHCRECGVAGQLADGAGHWSAWIAQGKCVRSPEPGKVTLIHHLSYRVYARHDGLHNHHLGFSPALSTGCALREAAEKEPIHLHITLSCVRACPSLSCAIVGRGVDISSKLGIRQPDAVRYNNTVEHQRQR